MKALRSVNKYFYQYKKLLLLGVLFICLSTGLKVYNPILVQETIDFIVNFTKEKKVADLTEHEKSLFYKKIFELSAYIFALALSSGFFLYLTRQTIIVMSRRVEYNMKNEIYEHYQKLPLSFYRSHNTGDLMNRISDDVSKVRMYVGPAIMYGLNLVIVFAMVIPIMLSVNVELTFYCLLPLPFLSIGIYFISDRMNKQSDRIQSSLSDLSTLVQEAFSGIRVIKTFIREKDSYAKFEKESNEYRQKSLDLALTNSFFFPIIFGLIGLSTIATIYFGGIRVLDGEITYGNIAQFFLYLNMITWPVTSLGWVTSIVQRASASQQRINQFLDTEDDLQSGDEVVDLKGKVEFKNVDLIYPDSGIQALKDVSFSINPGESLAIVGGTGSGKSSIANLISRMYDPTNGVISFDDIPVQRLNIHEVREQIGYVPQDAFLFSDSIRNNIAFANDEMLEKAIYNAAENAGVHSNIEGFPKGYETVLGERGITLSGGQKQRITLARAMIKDPKILVLDDSLSAVDTKTEDHILNSLKRIMKGKTSIIISHRVSSVKLADRIIVLNAGEIVQHGTHAVLMAEDGPYKDLYESQLEEIE